jgi:hypothetical protein
MEEFTLLHCKNLPASKRCFFAFYDTHVLCLTHFFTMSKKRRPILNMLTISHLNLRLPKLYRIAKTTLSNK